jgi:regulator of sigma E protease
MGPEAVGRYFHFKPLWQRALVVLAGPLANFVLATVIFTTLTMSLGEPYQRPLIETVEPGSAAAAAGFKAGDEIVGLNGRKADNFFTVAEFIGQNANHPIHFEVRRAGRVLDLWATPAETTRPDMFGRPMRLGLLGVRAGRPRSGQPLTRRLDPATALERGVERVYSTVSTTVHYVGRIFQGRESGNQIGGPIGTALLSKAVVQAGAASGHTWGDHTLGVALSLLELIAFISVSIGFVNLLPIPMLDGGHLLFYGFEAVARRPLTAQFQAASYRVGLALVVGLMLFATWNDLQLPILKILGGRFS